MHEGGVVHKRFMNLPNALRVVTVFLLIFAASLQEIRAADHVQ